MNIEEEEKHFPATNNNVFKGFKGGPFEHTMIFFPQNIYNFFLLMKNAFGTNSGFFFTKICK